MVDLGAGEALLPSSQLPLVALFCAQTMKTKIQASLLPLLFSADLRYVDPVTVSMRVVDFVAAADPYEDVQFAVDPDLVLGAFPIAAADVVEFVA